MRAQHEAVKPYSFVEDVSGHGQYFVVVQIGKQEPIITGVPAIDFYNIVNHLMQ